MASLKDLQNRIRSVKNTQKITRAMQMVAAAKLRRAQEAAESSRPYSDRIGAVIANLSSSMTGSESAPELLIGTGSDQVHLLVVATADRGLCGGFNSSIVRRAQEEIVRLEKAGRTVRIFCIGKKGREQLERLYGDRIVEFVSLREHKTLGTGVAADIGRRINEMFAAGEFDICKLVYSEFKNVMVQTPVLKIMIPAVTATGIDVETGKDSAVVKAFVPDPGGAAYEYEPDEEGIWKTLLPRNINTQIFLALLENNAGEMGSKMTAMDSATRNAAEMIDKLTLTFNRTRQAKITSELIEIISGAEAL